MGLMIQRWNSLSPRTFLHRLPLQVNTFNEDVDDSDDADIAATARDPTCFITPSPNAPESEGTAKGALCTGLHLFLLCFLTPTQAPSS